MRALILVALCPVAFGRFSWLDTAMSSLAERGDDDAFSNLLGDINLDISLNPKMSTTDIDGDSDTVDWDSSTLSDPNDMFIDESPSSMFSSLGPFGGLFDSLRSMSPLFGAQRPSFGAPQPLFLSMESEDIPSRNGPFSSSVLRLQHSDRVSGNTFRFTLKSDGANREFWTESWSAPKMYLCTSESCGRENGMEMVDILGDIRRRSYFHLVPTTMASMPSVMEMERFADSARGGEEDYASWSWLDFARQRARGCRERMEGLREWYFGGDDGAAADDAAFSTTASGGEIVFEIGPNAEGEERAQPMAPGDDLFFGVAAMTMVAVSLCGVLYSCYRFRAVAARRMKRYDPSNYVVMYETDGF